MMTNRMEDLCKSLKSFIGEQRTQASIISDYINETNAALIAELAEIREIRRRTNEILDRIEARHEGRK